MFPVFICTFLYHILSDKTDVYKCIAELTISLLRNDDDDDE